MSAFGRRSGGGRRIDRRAPAVTPAVFTTVTRSRSTLVSEVSVTGARLEGNYLPAKGESLVLHLGSLEAFCTVRWTKGNQCGVQFEMPLSDEVVKELRRDTKLAIVDRALLDGKQAFDDWNTGLAR